MKIFFTGGSGFIGSTLWRELLKEGHEVTLLVRSLRKRGDLQKGVSYIIDNPTMPGPWQGRLAEHDVVVNLAGASIFQRWNNRAKKEIFDSRVLSTKNIVDALSMRKGKETHLFSASGVGYYGFHEDDVLDENNSPGKDFLAHLTSEWESEALNAERFGVRVVLCRFGIVLGKKGGAMSRLVPLFRLHIGSSWGSGRQWFSWIHEQDVVNIFLFLLQNKNLKGPVNFTAPSPVQNKEMVKIIGEVMRKTQIIPAVPSFVLRLVLGEFGNVFLKGQRVIPRKLLEGRFTFRFQDLREASKDLIKP